MKFFKDYTIKSVIKADIGLLWPDEMFKDVIIGFKEVT